MSTELARIETAQLPADQVQPATDDSSMESVKRIGLVIFVLVFVIFGGWAALMPIDGAARAPGEVTVRSYSKVVQHLEGGIISDILVENGDVVEAGQPLLHIDDTQPLAQLEIVRSQFVALMAREARLIAERDGLDEVVYPEQLNRDNPGVREEITAQNQIFRARKATNEGAEEVLEQRIEQLQSKLVGLRALKVSKERLAASFKDELADTEALLAQGFSDKTRLRDLERNVAAYEGEAADLTANISSTEVQIGETRMQILQQNREFQNQVVGELSDTQTQLRDVTERINALEDVVSRTVVRAPASGIVNGMQFHTIGGVISPGTKIVDIVPLEDDLIIEARVSPVDIDRVALNQEATIRFSSFGSRVPTIYGEVIHLSADSYVDEATSTTYYLARIEVTPEGMENLGDLIMMPGMPAEVFISTGSRTFLQYLFKPFSNVMARSFRED